MNENLPSQIQLLKSVFKGREDVFAVRWEKENKSGYMPAYFFDPFRYRAHKIKGGTFQNFADKSYLRLTDDEIAKHLKGEQLAGIYPLLPDMIILRGLLQPISTRIIGLMMPKNFWKPALKKIFQHI